MVNDCELPIKCGSAKYRRKGCHIKTKTKRPSNLNRARNQHKKIVFRSILK